MRFFISVSTPHTFALLWSPVFTHGLCLCVQVLKRSVLLLYFTQNRGRRVAPGTVPYATSRGCGCEPPVELARGLADTLRVVRNDRGRGGRGGSGRNCRRGAAEAVGGTLCVLCVVKQGQKHARTQQTRKVKQG